MSGKYAGLISCILIVVQASLPLPSNFTSWSWLSSIVVGNYLYIDGGEYYTIDAKTGHTGNELLQSTLAIDLSTSWTNSSVSAYSNERGIKMKTSRKPLLWYNAENHTVHEWSGWGYNGSHDENENWVWTFTPDGHGGSRWSQGSGPPQDTEGNSPITSFGSSAIYTPSAFYSLGGTLVPDRIGLINRYPDTSIQGLLSHNFLTGDWTNTSSIGFAKSGFSVLGEASFVPNFGEEGLLVFLGGESPLNVSYHYQGASALVDMGTVPLYDIHTGTWHHQATTGDVPAGRTGLCVAGASPVGNSSVEIFVYGGYSNSSEESLESATADYEDVFVLSLPAFHWFRAAAGTRRVHHTCQTIGGRQMISIGGFGLRSDHLPAAKGNYTDPWTFGIGIFDMTDLSWSDHYDSKAMPYEQPNVVKQYYQSRPRNPIWNDPALAELFSTNTTSNSPMVTPTNTPAANHHGTNLGAIIGGAVGGLAGLCASLAFALFLLRRQRRNKKKLQDDEGLQNCGKSQSSLNTPGQTTTYSELPAEPKLSELGPSQVHELPTDPRSELDAPRP